MENFHTFISSEPKRMSKNGPNLNGIFEKTEAFGDLMGCLHDISRYFLSENVALFSILHDLIPKLLWKPCQHKSPYNC